MNRIRDSKKLSAKTRRELALLIQQLATASNCGLATSQEIDDLGIVEATRLAMKRAIGNLKIQPSLLLVDGRPIGNLGTPARFLIHGDARDISIAAASIVAKVFRDSLMVDLDIVHPGYNFAQHKGYGTQEHMARLCTLGPCSEHRRTFRPVSNMFNHQNLSAHTKTRVKS
jgi:ribonuclease HII